MKLPSSREIVWDPRAGLYALAAVLGGAFMVALGGCESNRQSAPPASMQFVDSEVTGTYADEKTLRELEQHFVIGPAAARELDYRIVWQYGEAGANLKHISVQDDSMYTLDGKNFLSRVRLSDGKRVWRVACTEPLDQVLGVNLVGNRLFVTTGGAMLLLDVNTGVQVGKQRLEKVAATAPVHYDQFLIYGSRDGQVIWHTYSIGHMYRGYQIARSMQIAPVLAGNLLAAVGNDGMVMVLNARAATQYWSKRLLAPVAAPPAVGEDSLYVAGTDQHLWAYDLETGRNLWRVLTKSPLRDSPVLIGDRVYQQVPSEGLVSLEARPPDTPGGKIVWTAPQVSGSVIFQRRDQLFAWDETSRVLTVVEGRRGGLVKSIPLPQVERLISAGKDGHDIFAASKDGRVVRIAPRT